MSLTLVFCRSGPGTSAAGGARGGHRVRPAAAGRPALHRGRCVLGGGMRVAAFNTMVNKIDRFLTWGASFSIFAQKQTTRNIANAAYLATVVVLRTDVLKPPKPSTRSRDSSSKGKWSARLPGVAADRPRSEWSAQPCSGGGLPTGRFWAE